MKFDRDSLLALAEQFEQKAEEFIEVADRIRNAASLFSGDEEIPEKPSVPVHDEPDKKLEHMTPLAQTVLDSLQYKIAGRDLNSITNYCQHHVGKGTYASVGLICRKLRDRGLLVRVGRGRYKIPTTTSEVNNGNTKPNADSAGSAM